MRILRTSSPPTSISEIRLNHIKKNLPERVWDREKKLEKLNLPKALVKSLAISRYYNLFNKIIRNLKVNPILIAVTFEEKLKSLRRKGKNIDHILDENFYQLFQMLSKYKFSKEAIPTILWIRM